MNPGAFLDRDGTINVDTGYVASPEKLEFTSGAVDAIRTLNQRGYRVAVITNQAGVARGFHTESDVDAFHAEMSRQLALADAHIDRFYYCPHHAEGTVAYKKLAVRGDHGNWSPQPATITALGLDFLGVAELCMTANEIA